MTGVTLIIVLAVMGGIIAFIADKLGSKIGKKRLRIFGLRPHSTSVLMTILTGILIAIVTMSILTVSSQEVRTALFGMKQLRRDIAELTTIKDDALKEVETQKTRISDLDTQIQKSKSDLTAANAQKDQAEKELASMQNSYREAQSRLTAAQAQIASVEAARDKLKGEVTDLEAATKKLRRACWPFGKGT